MAYWECQRKILVWYWWRCKTQDGKHFQRLPCALEENLVPHQTIRWGGRLEWEQVYLSDVLSHLLAGWVSSASPRTRLRLCDEKWDNDIKPHWPRCWPSLDCTHIVAAVPGRLDRSGDVEHTSLDRQKDLDASSPSLESRRIFSSLEWLSTVDVDFTDCCWDLSSWLYWKSTVKLLSLFSRSESVFTLKLLWLTKFSLSSDDELW